MSGGVVGFIVQCAICPQRAVLPSQSEQPWVCPRCAVVAGGFGDIDVAQAEPIAVRLPSHDPLAQALLDAPISQGMAVATVGGRQFILQTWTHKVSRCEHEYSAFETRWVPADPGCGHRYCVRQAAGFCLGAIGAQFDMAEDSAAQQRLRQQLAGIDPEWPATEVQG